METYLIKDADVWDKVLNKFVYDFYHLYSYVELCSTFENGQAALFFAQKDDNVFCLPVIIRPVPFSYSGEQYDAISPYGYPGPLVHTVTGQDRDNFISESLQGFIEICRANSIICAFVRFHPVLSPLSNSFKEYGYLLRHGETVSIDLSLSEEEMWRQIRYGHRSEIKKLLAVPHSVEVDSQWKYFSDFLEIYWQSMKRRNADKFYFFSTEYFNQLRDALGENLHLCVVKLDEQVACAGLFTEFNGIVQYHLSGTRTDYLRTYPNKLMLDYMRRWAKKRGNKFLHLGGGVGGHADSLFHFKAGFSKVRHSFYTWRAIMDDKAYAEMVRQWEIKSDLTADGIDGFFPAYRKE